MDTRFFKLFNLTEAEAIALIDTPMDALDDPSDKYIAVSHLINFPGEAAVQALIRAIATHDPADLDQRIVRRKAVESLGRLRATEALPTLRTCLADDDCYTVENAVWAIGEIGTQDPAMLEEIAQLLERPGQTYRVIIHTLSRLNYQPALDRIRSLVETGDQPTRSAAIAAVCRFTGDYQHIAAVVALLQHPNVNARRACIQDLIDARYFAALPDIVRCPVSVVFRLRAVRLLGAAGQATGELTFADLQPSLEHALRDHPSTLKLVHAYDAPPTLDFAVRELYDTDFGRCYLASHTLLENYATELPAALLGTYEAEAHNDYGAHYHVMKLLGWLHYAPAYELLVAALHNPAPQFQKSRTAAAIALGELGDARAIPELLRCLETPIWDLKYASLMALEQLGCADGRAIAAQDADWLVRAKATATAPAPLA